MKEKAKAKGKAKGKAKAAVASTKKSIPVSDGNNSNDPGEKVKNPPENHSFSTNHMSMVSADAYLELSASNNVSGTASANNSSSMKVNALSFLKDPLLNIIEDALKPVRTAVNTLGPK